MFTAALLIKIKSWNYRKCPSGDKATDCAEARNGTPFGNKKK